MATFLDDKNSKIETKTLVIGGWDMLLVFKVCFCAGLLLIMIAFVFGQFVNFIGIDGLDLSIGDVPLFFPFSPLLLFLFLTIFGGVGMLLFKQERKLPLVLILVIASVIGFIICYAIRHCILLPLKRAENTSAAAKEELIGLLAKVNEKIPKGGFGEITYTINGNSYVAPAKSTTGEAIAVGKEVSICWIEDHVFFVIQIDKLSL